MCYLFRVKTTKVLLAAFIASFCLISCNVDLISPNGPTSESYPQDGNEVQMGLFGAYRSLSEFTYSSTPYLNIMDNNTDIGYTRPGNVYTPLITSGATPSNALTILPWRYFYKAIARVHAVLDNMDKLESSMGEDSYNQLNGELRFIRAYCYSQLIEIYGGVPLLKSTVSLGETDVPRTSVEEIRDFIVSELTDIQDFLPVSQSGFGNARASQIAAYMLKARVLLYSKKYKDAKVAAQKAIELSAGVHDLTPFNSTVDFTGKDHTVGEPDPSNIFGHEGFKSSKEWIWVIEYNKNIPGNTHNRQYFGASRLANGASFFGPTQDLISSFQCIDGKSITESPLYDPLHPFANRDPRLDMYCARPGSRYLGFQFELNKDFKTVLNYWPINDGTGTDPISITNNDATNAYRTFSGYLWRKTMDIHDFHSTSVGGNSDLGVGVFRYAELLLIYAEAKIEDNDIDNSVYNAINQVRNRAHMPNLDQGMSQLELRKALRYERKVELCNEGLRWYDLRRWNIAKDVMNGYLYLNRAGNLWSNNTIAGFDDSYTPIYNHEEALKYFTTQPVSYKVGKDELWPLPESEMDANKALIPNP